MSVQQKYTFLELMKEADAVARGANLTDKINHSVFRAVKSMSTVENAKQNALFTPDMQVPGVVNLTKKDLLAVLNRLISEKLIAQIFRLDYEPGGGIKPVPCFIAVPGEERNTPMQLYTETLFASIRALELYMDSQPPATNEQVWKDFETDFSLDRAPAPSEIKSTIVDLFSGIHAGKFALVPPAELLSTTMSELEDALVRKGRAVKFLDYGLMPLREQEIALRFESAADFLTANVIPKFKSKGNVKKELEAVAIDESMYYSEEFASQSGDFTARRAAIIKKTLLAEPTRGKGARFPGALCIETILALEGQIRGKYHDKWRSEIARLHNEFRGSLLKPGGAWKDRIVFVDEKEVTSYPEEVWKRMLDDAELLHGVWERAESTVHVFVRRDTATFRLLVTGMMNLPLHVQWQVLAMKSLLEKNESEFAELFDDPDFITQYGALLRLVYVSLIPWYYRIFILLGLNWFQDRGFQIAKHKIMSEQRILEEKSKLRAEMRAVQLREEKQLKTARIRDLEVSNKIIEKIDQFLMTDSKIPSVSDIKASLPEIEEGSFQEILKRENFQIVQYGKGGDEQNILLYPLNHEWRVRCARIRRVMDRIKNLKPWDPGGPDKEIADKIKLILKHVSKTENQTAAEVSADDPYKRFEKELNKQKQKNSLPDFDDDDELEV